MFIEVADETKPRIIFTRGFFLLILRDDKLTLTVKTDDLDYVSMYHMTTVQNTDIFESSDEISECEPKDMVDGTQLWVTRDDIVRRGSVYNYEISREVVDIFERCWNSYFYKIYEEKPEYNYITMYTPSDNMYRDMMLGIRSNSAIQHMLMPIIQDQYCFFEFPDSNAIAREMQEKISTKEPNVTEKLNENTENDKENENICGNIRIAFVPPKSLKRFNPQEYQNDDSNSYKNLIYNAMSKDGMITTTMPNSIDALYVMMTGDSRFTMMDGVELDTIVSV